MAKRAEKGENKMKNSTFNAFNIQMAILTALAFIGLALSIMLFANERQATKKAPAWFTNCNKAAAAWYAQNEKKAM